MQSENQLMSVINSTRALTSILDLEEVLDRLIQEVRKVIHGSDAIVLFILNEKKQKLIPKSSYGFNMEHLKEIHLDLDEGMSGKTFVEKEPKIYYSSGDTTKGMENLFSENQENFFKAVEGQQFPTSSICVPLLIKGSCMGVLTIDSFTPDVLFTNRDLQLLETFASQAVIAIENARLFSQNRRSHYIHKELSSISLISKGLEEMILTLGRLIDKEICITNEFLDLIVSSSEGKREFDKLTKDHHSELQELVGYIDTSRIEFQDNTYIFPINNQESLLGLLFVFDHGDEPIDPLDLFATEQVKNLFSIEMINRQQRVVNKMHQQGIIVERLLQQDILHPFVKKFVSTKMHQYKSFVIATLAVENTMEWEEECQKQQQFKRIIDHEIRFLEFKTMVYEKNDRLIFMFCTDESPKEIEKRIKAFFHRIHQRMDKLDTFSYVVGIGNSFSDYTKVHISYNESEKCISYLQLVLTDQRTYSIADLGIHQLFLKQNPRDLKEIVQTEIGPLLSLESTDLLETLRTYLECGQSISKAAKQSYLHVNTIKYRIQKVRQLLDLPSTGPKLFQIQLTIYINDYLKQLNVDSN